MLRFLILVLMVFILPTKRIYDRTYHDNGKLASEGWKLNGQKEEFWKFYHTNGNIAEQGHYMMNLESGYWYFYTMEGKLEMEGHMQDGKKIKWWLFYDGNGSINHKCQLQDGIKNGYCLKYMDEELTSAEKYKNGKKIKEWFSFGAFKKENKLSDLK